MIPAPILVVGPPGPELSRLAAMLGRHPAACDLPELDVFVAPTVTGLLEIGRLSDGQTTAGLKRALAMLLHGRQDDEAVASAERWLSRRLDWRGADLFDEFMRRLAPRALVSADGTVAWRPDFIDRLLDQCPELRLLHLVEHPRTWCASRVAALADRLFIAPDYKDYATNPPLLDPQLGWLRAHCNLAEASAWLPPSQYRRVTVESLQAGPEAALAELCGWLGWTASTDVVAAMQRPEASPFAGYGPSTALLGADPVFIEAPAFLRRLRHRERLDGPLAWRPDGIGFADEVLRIAEGCGYR